MFLAETFNKNNAIVMIMLEKRIKDSSGFSLMELMVVIAMIGILSAVALPGILHALPEQRLKNAARNLYADMQRARMLAVKENKRMYVKFSGSDTADAADDFYYCVDDTKKGPENAVFRRNLSEDGDVSFGKTNNISFGPTGSAGTGSTYLKNQNQDVCYVIITTRHGHVRIDRKETGCLWN
ncbi:hypothetical protein GCAAIG_08660 [Candidatus Electronema halotolerans]